MSYRTIDWVYNQQLPAQDKLILVYIAKCENEQEPCFASVKLLAAKCGVSARTVQRILKKLCEADLFPLPHGLELTAHKPVTSTLLTLSGMSQLCHPPMTFN
ncbi:helix-turn-helix domain-containing protein [Pseudomonas fluorescens]|uniref:helix-turn-helix domain-containing protein n=1 Tax=Pseudomonas fluorescens TaxID=294 RepID=UPI000B438234